MKKLLVLAVVPMVCCAGPFNVASSSTYQKLQCKGDACTWLEWSKDSAQAQGSDVVVSGSGKIAYSEKEEQRSGKERFVDAKDIAVVATCSTSNPSISINGMATAVDLNALDQASAVYMHVCHGVSPVTPAKAQEIGQKYQK